MMDLPRSFLRKRSTDCEYTGLSLIIVSGDAIYVFRLCFTGVSIKEFLLFISDKLFKVFLLISSASLMGARLFARFANFSFF
jgi:hypothetical protein